MDKFPRPTLPKATPPSLDKAVITLVQKKKSVLAHAEFHIRYTGINYCNNRVKIRESVPWPQLGQCGVMW